MKSIEQLAREHFANAIVTGDVTFDQCVDFCKIVAENHDNLLFQARLELSLLRKQHAADMARLQAQLDVSEKRRRDAVVALGYPDPDANIC